MPNTDNLCMSCMKPIGDAKQCPYCGYHADSPQLSPYLPIRSVVANRYLVGKVLEFNGDGVTYAGWDMTERIAVKVREFLPDAICSRENGETQVRVMQGCERAYTDCYQSFLELWRKLMRLMGLSALISVTDVVEDNGTAYAIYEYTDAVPLRKYQLRGNIQEPRLGRQVHFQDKVRIQRYRQGGLCHFAEPARADHCRDRQRDRARHQQRQRER